MRPLVAVLPLAIAAAVACACNMDPMHDSAVSALGPESANVPQGQYHRAGQPCVTCHGSEGPANAQFSIAGTVFYGPGTASAPVGVGNVTVLLEDDAQSMFQVTTNCVGNFWVVPSDWVPQYPVLVTIAGAPKGTTLQVSMQSHIGRDPSCGNCHQISNAQNTSETPGLIHFVPMDDPAFTGDTACPVQPTVAGLKAP